MIDRNKLAQARTWSARINRDSLDMTHRFNDNTLAAAEVINTLPADIISADDLDDIINKMNGDLALEGDDEWDKGFDRAVEKYKHLIIKIIKQARAPRPAEIPTGEAWFVEVNEREAIGYRNDPLDSFPWLVIYRSTVDFEYACDDEVTLTARATADTDNE